MNDSVDVKRHVYLRTIAKLKVHAEFFFGDSVNDSIFLFLFFYFFLFQTHSTERSIDMNIIQMQLTQYNWL